MAKNQKSYTPEFKQQIIDLFNIGGYSYPQLKRGYGIGPIPAYTSVHKPQPCTHPVTDCTQSFSKSVPHKPPTYWSSAAFAVRIISIGSRWIPLTLHSADRKQMITDTDEDKTPISKLHSIMPDTPTFKRYFSLRIFATPRRWSAQSRYFSSCTALTKN